MAKKYEVHPTQVNAWKRKFPGKAASTGQGSQLTSEVFTGCLKKHEVQISMNGKGRAIETIFIERLWRSVKCEHVYLHTPADGVALYKGLNNYFTFYNRERLHQSLDYLAPEVLYKKAAACRSASGLAVFVTMSLLSVVYLKQSSKKEIITKTASIIS